MSRVHREYINCRSPDRGESDDAGAIDLEMASPIVSAWVEERNEYAILRIDAGEVRSLVAMTMDAGKRKIFEVVAAQMLPCADVLDVVPRLRMRLWKSARLASFPGPLPDEGTNRGIHQVASWLARYRRALDLIRARISAPST